MVNHKDEIIKLVSENSYFDCEVKDGDTLEFSTRKNGSVGDEIASYIDFNEAKRLRTKIQETFKGLNVKIECVDEWVLFYVSNHKESVIIYKYAFIKRCDKGCGFGETFNSMSELLDKYKSWLEIDWSAVEKQMNELERYPNEILISRAREVGNNWGYNFYITKTKEIL